MSLMPTNQGQPVMQDISRQRKFAEELRRQGSEELKGQMVSGIYVAPSWTQGLAKLLQQGVGAYQERKADEREKDYDSQKGKRFADILSGNKEKRIEIDPTVTQTMPAYTPEQQDQFGSPLQGVQRTPQEQITQNFRQEAPEEVQARQQEAILGYMQEYGQTPEAQIMLAQLNKQDDRAYARGEKLDDRNYQGGIRAEDRANKVFDINDQRRYEDIVRADQQGFQVSQQDRQFANQFQLQAQNQGFQSGESALNRNFQAGQNQLSRDNTLQVAASKSAGNPSEGERKAATLLSRMQSSQNQLKNALEGNADAAKPGVIAKGLSNFGLDMLANKATPEARQQVEAAQLDILDSALTLGTGAAYTREQLEGYRKSYFPQIGDSPKTIADKEARLTNVIDAAKVASGRATPTSGVPLNNNGGVRTVDW